MDITGNCHVLRGVAGTASLTVVDSSVTTFGAATVVVTAHDGTTVEASTAATGAGGSGATGATYTFRLSATDTAKLDILSLAWTIQVDGVPETVTTYAEVIGSYIFSIAEARAFDRGQLANAATYPDSDIAAARLLITDAFQDICTTAFVPRYGESFIRHDGGFSAGDYGGWYQWSPVDRPEILMPYPFIRALREVAVSYWAQDWVVQDLTAMGPVELTDEGLIRGIFPHGFLRIRYEHGMDKVPAAIHKAALQVLLLEMIPDNLPERASSYELNGNVYRISMPDGVRKWYGIPTVDSVLSRYAFVNIG